MVILRNVSKRFGNTVAVDSLSLEIPSGQVLGLLGENGAGKTTLMNILAGYLPATSGDVSINGADMLSHPLAARSAVGYMPEQVPVYPELTVLEYLDYCCALKN
ncbi:MAG: ATP-binding cassette domain-containing protein, partial [Clostridiales bacterium]|nr:ATP-binding cassette domain-containing protein [Clostridiales bacterium]